jgi:hypothetical protein
VVVQKFKLTFLNFTLNASAICIIDIYGWNAENFFCKDFFIHARNHK